MTALLPVLRGSARIGLGDLRVVYTPRSWSVAWCGRGVAQVLFFGLVGVLSGIDGRGADMALGNAVLLIAISGLLGVASTGWERSEGTLVFLIAGGGSVPAALLGRSLQHLLAGYPAAVVGAGVALAVWPPGPLAPEGVAAAAAVLLAIGVSATAMAMVLGAALLRFTTGRNLVSNVTYTLLMVLCGVNFPVERLPAPFEWLASLLPVTHGLAAIRALVIDASFVTAARGLALELLVASGWFFAGVLVLRGSVLWARRRGTLDWMY